MRMKFMSSFQCLMGNSGVSPLRFQDPSSSSTTIDRIADDGSGIVVVDSHHHTKRKKKWKKQLKQQQQQQNDDDGQTSIIKVFKPDGQIDVYHNPIKVSEVMTEEYMVCRSDCIYIGQKIPALSQHDCLQLGHTYFLLPTHLFHSVLSFVTISSFAAAATSSCSPQQKDDDNNNNNNIHGDHMKIKAAFLKKAAASSCPPFDIQKTPSGTLRIRVSEHFISQLMMDHAAAAAAAHDHHKKSMIQAFLCTTPQLYKEYNQLVVGSRRGWKPKLEMIKETPPLPPKGNRKVKRLLSASINHMKRKISNNKNKKKKKKINKNVVNSETSSTSSSIQTHSSQPPHPQQKKNKKKKTKSSSSKAVAHPHPPIPPCQPQTGSSSLIKSSKSKINLVDPHQQLDH